jgi:subtilase family serine protease
MSARHSRAGWVLGLNHAVVPCLTAVAIFTLLGAFDFRPLTTFATDHGRVPEPHQVRNSTLEPEWYSVSAIRHAYGFDQVKETGRGQILAIVVAFHDRDLPYELEQFDETMHVRQMYGLPHSAQCTVADGPHPCLEQASTVARLRSDDRWSIEQAADVEWAHAMAPAADILVVEAASAEIADLITAAGLAADLGSAVVSMSWGVSESADLRRFDPIFDRSGVVFVAASGDNGHGVSYPAVSPHVVAVGGTVLTLHPSGERASEETAWWGSGGGISSVEPHPTFQSVGLELQGRAVPDISYAAEPGGGYPVYAKSAFTGWLLASGTSVATPQWAAVVALVIERGGEALSSNSFLSKLYELAQDPAAYRRSFVDVTQGLNGACGAPCSAHDGYDLVTGLGAPNLPGIMDFWNPAGHRRPQRFTEL